MLSNNSNFRVKIFFFHLYGYMVVGVISGVFVLTGKVSIWFLMGLPLLFPLFYLSFCRKIKKIAVNVFTSGENLHYDLDHKSHRTNKFLIQEIYDSGFFSGAQEIIVKFKDGGEFAFFPSRNYGSYFRGAVVKELNLWLTGSSENSVLKKGMPKPKATT